MKVPKELQDFFSADTGGLQYFGSEAVDMALCIVSRTNARFYLFEGGRV